MSSDPQMMQLALEVARAGEGWVEPNPMVGCVISVHGEVIGIGAHQQYGGPHAEIDALQSIAPSARGRLAEATAWVTLEPCSHVGKTGPCADALIEAGIGRVVVAVVDPDPRVAGRGIQRLRDAGVQVEVGCQQDQARSLLAPYLKRTQTGFPWIIAKWAMSVDGRIATHTGNSQWISNARSRAQVHQLRRVDAVMVGIGTALADDPRLTARPDSGPPSRIAKRIVIDPQARIPLDSRLVTTARKVPVLLGITDHVDATRQQQLQDAGCELFVADNREQLLPGMLRFLGDQGLTNVMVEGGTGLLGSLLDIQQIDEAHVYLGPKLIGGAVSPGPIGGQGIDTVDDAWPLALQTIDQFDDDVRLIYRRP